MRHASFVRARLAVVPLACVALVGCESITNLVATAEFEASMRGDNVRPTPVQTTGTGRIDIRLTSDTSALRYVLTYTGLSGPATAAHIHGPASDTTSAAPILVNFDSLPTGGQGTIQLGTNGSAEGSFDLALPITPGMPGNVFFRLLHADSLYADVHTTTNPLGEIRGQVKK